MEQLLLNDNNDSLIPVTLSNSQEQEKWDKLLQSGCVVKLKISLPSNTIKVEKGKIKEVGEGAAPVVVDATKSLVKVSTSRFVSVTYEEITSLANEVRGHIKEMGFPYYGHDGEYIIPVKKLGEALSYLKKKKEEWDKKIALFLSQWEDIKQESLEQLRGLGNNKNYPPVTAIQEKFSWFYTVKTISADFSLPDNLQEVDEKLYEETVEVMKDNLKSTLSLLEDTITEGMIEIIRDISSNLETGGKKINKKTFEKGMEMCKFLLEGGGNLIGNSSLTQVCEDFKKLISGDSAGLAKQVKNSQGTKEMVQASLANFHKTLTNLMSQERNFDL